MRRAARELLRGLGGEPAVVLCGGSALLVISNHQGSAAFFRAHLAWVGEKSGAAQALPYFWWYGTSVLLYLAAPLLLARATGGSFTRSYGLRLGEVAVGVRLGLLLLAVMLPAAWLASRTAAFKGQYPLAGAGAYQLWPGSQQARGSLPLFAAYEAAYFAYFIGWEFFFRGWMLNGLLPTFGRAGAVLVPTAPFVLMHLGKPEPEALGAIVAGVALGVLALRTRSFWYGAVLHGVVAVWMDVVSAFPYLGRP
ncbi:MAG TPA: CPBP family intramembrane glutamic endopeptidase [Myxococcales bacterium]|nr:CPBP family intramembrane glutamic endopeptidase [Myxococcales bacterium]